MTFGRKAGRPAGTGHIQRAFGVGAVEYYEQKRRIIATNKSLQEEKNLLDPQYLKDNQEKRLVIKNKTLLKFRHFKKELGKTNDDFLNLLLLNWEFRWNKHGK